MVNIFKYLHETATFGTSKILFQKFDENCKLVQNLQIMSEFTLIVGIAISQLPEGTEIRRQHCCLFRSNRFPVAFLVVNLSSIYIRKPCLLTLWTGKGQCSQPLRADLFSLILHFVL